MPNNVDNLKLLYGTLQQLDQATSHNMPNFPQIRQLVEICVDQFDPIWKEYQFQKKQGQVGVSTAPADAAADVGVDASPATNNVDKEAPYKNQNLPKKKKKKKKDAVSDILTAVKNLKSRFDAQSTNLAEFHLQSKPAKFDAQSKAFNFLEKAEESLQIAQEAMLIDTSTLNFYICANSLNSVLNETENILNSVQNLLIPAEMQNLEPEVKFAISLVQESLTD